MLVGTFYGLYTGIPTERLQLTRSITCIKHRTRVRARAHTHKHWHKNNGLYNYNYICRHIWHILYVTAHQTEHQNLHFISDVRVLFTNGVGVQCCECNNISQSFLPIFFLSFCVTEVVSWAAGSYVISSSFLANQSSYSSGFDVDIDGRVLHTGLVCGCDCWIVSVSSRTNRTLVLVADLACCRWMITGVGMGCADLDLLLCFL